MTLHVPSNVEAVSQWFPVSSNTSTTLFCRATVASKAKDPSGRAALLADKADAASKWDASTKAGQVLQALQDCCITPQTLHLNSMNGMAGISVS